MLRQLVYVFIIMAFDKLKSIFDDLTATAQCECMDSEFEGDISTLDLNEDMFSILSTESVYWT